LAATESGFPVISAWFRDYVRAAPNNPNRRILEPGAGKQAIRIRTSRKLIAAFFQCNPAVAKGEDPVLPFLADAASNFHPGCNI
jgi:hypothetical protein